MTPAEKLAAERRTVRVPQGVRDPAMVRRLRSAHADGVPVRDLARRFQLGTDTVRALCKAEDNTP